MRRYPPKPPTRREIEASRLLHEPLEPSPRTAAAGAARRVAAAYAQAPNGSTPDAAAWHELLERIAACAAVGEHENALACVHRWEAGELRRIGESA